MSLFSERNNYVEKLNLQEEELVSPLSNMIFNELCKVIRFFYENSKISGFQIYYNQEFFYRMEPDYFIWTDENDFIKFVMKKDWENLSWHKKYSLVEFFYSLEELNQSYIKDLNWALEKGKSAYRMVDYKIVKITNETEQEAIKKVFKSSIEDGIKKHLSNAIKFLSVSDTPDYKKSIQESISAVGSLLRHKTGENTMGEALKKFHKKSKLPTVLKSGLEKIYAYTNGKEGIRHVLMRDR